VTGLPGLKHQAATHLTDSGGKINGLTCCWGNAAMSIKSDLWIRRAAAQGMIEPFRGRPSAS